MFQHFHHRRRYCGCKPDIVYCSCAVVSAATVVLYGVRGFRTLWMFNEKTKRNKKRLIVLTTTRPTYVAGTNPCVFLNKHNYLPSSLSSGNLIGRHITTAANPLLASTAAAAHKKNKSACERISSICQRFSRREIPSKLNGFISLRVVHMMFRDHHQKLLCLP